jgi:hypothetical protein
MVIKSIQTRRAGYVARTRKREVRTKFTPENLMQEATLETLCGVDEGRRAKMNETKCEVVNWNHWTQGRDQRRVL